MAVLTGANVGHFAQLNVGKTGLPVFSQGNASFRLVQSVAGNHFDALNDGTD